VAAGYVLQPDDPSQVRSPLGGCVRSDGEARWVQQLTAAPDSVDTSSLGRMAFGHVLQHTPYGHPRSFLVSTVPGTAVRTDPRKSEVVRTSRSNADDAEFEREDPED
jgi:hypothetical protein